MDKKQKKDYSKNFTQVKLKIDQDYKRFEEICKELGLKKATTIKLLIKAFNKNPKKMIEKIFWK